MMPKLDTDVLIIDTHVHVWKAMAPWMSWLADRPANWDSLRRDFSFTNLCDVLDGAGVGELILVQAGMTPSETLELLDIAESQDRVVGVVGWASLQSERSAEDALRSFKERGDKKLVGIRNNHMWAPDGDIIARPEARAACRLLARHGLVIDLHFRDYSELPIAIDLVEAMPEARFVIDHLGKPLLREPGAFEHWAAAMTTLSQAPNVYVKYSGWATFAGRAHADDVRRYITRAIELFGPERIMYASNWPVALAAADYRTTFEATRAAMDGLDRNAYRAVFRDTAAACYGIDARKRSGFAARRP